MTETTTKREQLREERRRQILDAALTVFGRKGYHAANVSDVAAEAGVSQGTIYWYFDSKETLLQHLLDEAFEEMLHPYVVVLSDTTKTPTMRLREAFRATRQLSVEGGEKLRLLVNLWSQPLVAGPDGDEQGQMARVYADQVLEPLQRVIEEGMAAGEIAPHDARPLAVALGAMMDGLMLYGLIWPDGLVDDAALEQVIVDRILVGNPR